MTTMDEKSWHERLNGAATPQDLIELLNEIPLAQSIGLDGEQDTDELANPPMLRLINDGV